MVSNKGRAESHMYHQNNLKFFDEFEQDHDVKLLFWKDDGDNREITQRVSKRIISGID